MAVLEGHLFSIGGRVREQVLAIVIAETGLKHRARFARLSPWGRGLELIRSSGKRTNKPSVLCASGRQRFQNKTQIGANRILKT